MTGANDTGKHNGGGAEGGMGTQDHLNDANEQSTETDEQPAGTDGGPTDSDGV